MKGTIMRLGAALLALTLLLGSLAGCGKNNPSVLTLPDATAAAQEKTVETPAPLTPLGDRTCYVGKETIPESTLFSFILKSANFDPLMGLTLTLGSTNKSNQRDFIGSLNYRSVDGYMQDANYEASVPRGQSVQGEILIPADALRSAGVSTVDELILYPLIYDDSVPMGQGDAVDGAFTFYPTGQTKGTVVYPVRQKTATEMTFFDNGFGTMVLLDAKTDGEDGMTVDCYLENKTDRFLSFGWDDGTMNGSSVSFGSEDTIVAPGMRRYVALDVTGVPADASELTFKVTGTPLSSTGNALSPLVEQRGTYRLVAAADDPTGDGGDDTDPDDPAATASPAPTTLVYTKPTAAMQKNAKKGYVKADKVNMRSGPGTNYSTVGKKVDENSSAVLYELQNGWWFLKCNNRYGYIKADYIAQGKPKATPKPTRTPAPTAPDGGKAYSGTVVSQSIAALRKSPDTDSKCLKELSNGASVTVYYKVKGTDGKAWYYVASGKTKGYIRADLLKTSKKVPSK